MRTSVSTDILQVAVLFCAGFGGGLCVGIGSGTAAAVMIPTITLFTGQPIHKAIGTSLLVDSVIGATAGMVFLKNRHVNLRSAAVLAVTAVIGALIGSRFTMTAPESELNGFIALILIVLGLNFLIKGIQKNIAFVESKVNFSLLRQHTAFFLAIFGLCSGLLSGFSGLGVGAIVALVLIFILGYEIHTAIGTSLLLMAVIAGSGAVGHIFSGEFLVQAAIVSVSGAGIGGLIGSSYANRINAFVLGRVIGIIILVFGLILLFRTFFSSFIPL
jgi:uncharacterized membrane protein YfcA